MTKIFDQNNIILLQIDENDLMSFIIDMDIDDSGQPLFPLDLLTEELMNVIPEYVYAEYDNPSLNNYNLITKLREAAKSIYKIKEFDLMRKVYLSDDATIRSQATQELKKLPFRNRGEFGELLLHFLLRDFKNTLPLVSKVYFKDSNGVPAHGFDAVHISPQEEILWLGESKLYTNPIQGVDSLLKDLREHLTTDYLNDQFIIIKKNLNNNSIPQRDYWIKTLSSASYLKDKLKIINIPMLCVYEHDIYNKFTNSICDEAIAYHKLNARDLKKYFDDNNTHPLKTSCNVILMLLPIKSKYEFVKKLHERLWHMQNI